MKKILDFIAMGVIKGIYLSLVVLIVWTLYSLGTWKILLYAVTFWGVVFWACGRMADAEYDKERG